MDTVFQKNIPLTLLKRLCVRGELETEPPSSSSHSSASFSFSWAAQPGAWGPSLSAESWFPQLDLEHWLQALNYNCLTSCVNRVISLFYAHSIHPVDTQGYPLIFSTRCICYLHRCISHLTAWPSRRSICNTITILATTVGTFYGLNYFNHVIYMLQTSTNQNIAKFFIHPCAYIYIYI